MATLQHASVVIGCGAVGQRLLKRLPSDALSLGVSRRTVSMGRPWLSLDLDSDPLDGLLAACAGAVVYYFAPPSSTSEQDDRGRRFLGALDNASTAPIAVVLISTTGVYGDCAGEWVDESRAINPQVARSRRRADSEQCWRAYGDAAGVPVAVLRVAGIYGPNKLPVSRLNQAQPILCEEQSPYSNRVHIDDLVDIALAVAGSNTLVNVADGSPSTMTAYFHALADALGVSRLAVASREQLEAEWSEGLRSYMSESRRIDNSLMKKILERPLRYPQLAAGLAASVAEQA